MIATGRRPAPVDLRRRLLVAIAMMLLAAACGGGSESGGDAEAPPEPKPSKTTVAVDGNDSSDAGSDEPAIPDEPNVSGEFESHELAAAVLTVDDLESLDLTSGWTLEYGQVEEPEDDDPSDTVCGVHYENARPENLTAGFVSDDGAYEITQSVAVADTSSAAWLATLRALTECADIEDAYANLDLADSEVGVPDSDASFVAIGTNVPGSAQPISTTIAAAESGGYFTSIVVATVHPDPTPAETTASLASTALERLTASD